MLLSPPPPLLSARRLASRVRQGGRRAGGVSDREAVAMSSSRARAPRSSVRKRDVSMQGPLTRYDVILFLAPTIRVENVAMTHTLLTPALSLYTRVCSLLRHSLIRRATIHIVRTYGRALC